MDKGVVRVGESQKKYQNSELFLLNKCACANKVD